VTRVDEWTKADTGVGAAIAAGSHALKGIWALFVHKANNKILVIIIGKYKDSVHINIIDQCDCESINLIDMRISTSPIRFVIAVIIPAANDLLFW